MIPSHVHPVDVQMEPETWVIAVIPNKPPEIQYKALIDCLIIYESSGDPEAVGDSGNAFGILQFWLGTFQSYKMKYGLDHLEYKNPDHQIILADRMLRDDFGNIRHWSTRHKCL